MFRNDLLAGKRILITGGGTGLGRAMAERFVALGARVAICGRRAEVLDETARALGEAVETRVCDIRDASAVEGMVASLWESGPLDALMFLEVQMAISRVDRFA